MSEEDKKKISDFLKRAIDTGLGAAFMTEDMIRSALADISNKESVNTIIQNAKNARDEFVGSVKSEVGTYLKKIDLQTEIDRILAEYDLDINAKISFRKKAKHSEDE